MTYLRKFILIVYINSGQKENGVQCLTCMKQKYAYVFFFNMSWSHFYFLDFLIKCISEKVAIKVKSIKSENANLNGHLLSLSWHLNAKVHK